MNFFQLQNKLFYSKKENAGELDSEGEQAFVPCLKWQRISYIKKKKKEEDEVEGLSSIAKNKNISKREMLQYVELQKSLRK